ncbi:MAG: hypothetical protein ACYDHM_07775 [Acidiferrobacterales bacterium]
MKRDLTLVVPGLFGAPPPEDAAPAPCAPALEILLARASPVSAGLDAQTVEALLCALFGIHAPEEGDLPVAAITRLADSGVSDGDWWIRADPVHLVPCGAGLVLSGNELLDLSTEESLRLVAELGEIFTPDRWRLEAPRLHRWYLRSTEPARIRTHSVDEVSGRDIGGYLPDGRDAQPWHMLLNEVQLLLHVSPLNAERERRGRPPVNSLWFWGGGVLPSVGRSEWTAVWSDGPLACGLGQLAGVSVHSLPSDAAHWLQAADVAGAHLLAFEPGPVIGQHGDSAAWRESVESFEQRWLAPLLSALRPGDISSLTLYSERCAGKQLTAANLRRWWRRRRPLSSYG